MQALQVQSPQGVVNGASRRGIRAPIRPEGDAEQIVQAGRQQQALGPGIEGHVGKIRSRDCRRT